MSQHCAVRVRFFPPPEELRDYITTIYLIEWDVAPGEILSDHILPEWPNLRFHSGDLPIAPQQPLPTCFPAAGPRSHCLPFQSGSSRMWGTGLLPLGWAKFVRVPAIHLANQLVDGLTHSAYASFVPLARSIYGKEADPAAELARFVEHFLRRSDAPVEDEVRIRAIYGAVMDPEVLTVVELAGRACITERTLERLCKRHFGFAPKRLLRRQRFMRSLADFLIDPSLKWIGAMDSQYYDQAQFFRDFQQFMGMSPRQFAALDRPILNAVAAERKRLGWAGVQSLDNHAG